MTTTTIDPAAPFRAALARVGLPGWLTWSVNVGTQRGRLDAVVEPTGAVQFAVPAGADPDNVAAAARRMLGRLLAAAAHKRDHGARIEARSLINGEEFRFVGRSLRLVIVDNGAACEVRPLPVGRRRPERSTSTGPVALLCLRRDQAHPSTVIEWYRQQGQAWLDQHLPPMAQRLHVMDSLTWSVRPYRARERWDGSWGRYRASHSIDLPWQAFQFPPDLLRYVVAHEVAHAALGGAYGHGRQWQMVLSRLVPNWRELDGPARSADGLVLWSGDVTGAAARPKPVRRPGAPTPVGPAPTPPVAGVPDDRTHRTRLEAAAGERPAVAGAQVPPSPTITAHADLRRPGPGQRPGLSHVGGARQYR